jgi:phage FluMu gp28-like protein
MASEPVKLYEYQKRWVEDQSRFKAGLWARQTGKSFATALEAVLSAAKDRQLWVLLSRGERQSRELMEKVRMHAQALKLAAQSLEGIWSGESSFKALETRLPGGGRIIGLPANPDTARGFSGNVVLDEFAFHVDSRKIWQALYPSITRGYKIRVISTPNGQSGMFYELWTGDNRFSKHKVTIYDAVAQGAPLDVEELKAGILDPDAWAQEYECEFVDEAAALITYELLSSCEANCLWEEMPEEGRKALYLGMDIGRKRDLTAIWLAELVGEVLWTRRIVELEKTPFRDQRDVLFSLLPHVRRACIDATGLGMQLAEEAQERFGTYRVEAVTFTPAVKEELAMGLLRRFQDRAIRIPPSPRIRQDLHSVRKYVTAAGNVRYDSERTEASGHADRFWALALAVHAAGAPASKIEFRSVRPRDFVAASRWMEAAYG